jgi:hypothetical protein
MTLITRKLLKLRANPRVLRQHNITSEPEHSRRRITQRLLVELDIPDTRTSILRIARPGRINKPLLTSRMRADQRRQPMRLDGLILEKLDERVGIRVNPRQKTISASNATILPPNIGPNPRTHRTSHRRNRGTHLHQIGHGDAVASVRGVPGLHLRHDILQTVILRSKNLGGCEDERPVCAAAGPGVLGPAGCVVEAEADGGPGEVGAPARETDEFQEHLVADVLPDAAGVGFAGVGVLAG